MHAALSNALRWAAAFLLAVFGADLAAASPALAPERQNTLISRYCAVCHTDAADNGGLSLERFDAATAAPSLTAMLLSKITGGLALRTVREARTDPAAAALLDARVRGGAMNAAGLPQPAKPVVDALVASLAEHSADASDWWPHPAEQPGVASILREIPSDSDARSARAYRLIVFCAPDAREERLQLAWSPVPTEATFTAAADGRAATYRVEGSETMGDGSPAVTSGLAHTVLESPAPAHSLVVEGLFPDESVAFPFDELPAEARRRLSACAAR